jgi:hypothetical protein
MSEEGEAIEHGPQYGTIIGTVRAASFSDDESS